MTEASDIQRTARLMAHVLGSTPFLLPVSPVSLHIQGTGIQFDRAATRIALALDVTPAEAAHLLREKWATSWATDIDQAADAVIRDGNQPSGGHPHPTRAL